MSPVNNSIGRKVPLIFTNGPGISTMIYLKLMNAMDCASSTEATND